MKLVLRIPSPLALLAHGIFWGYNAIFIALVYFGLIPFELSGLADDFERGHLSGTAAAMLVAIGVTPLAATVFAALRLRRRPKALLALFFGVEAPLLLGLGFFALSDHTLTVPIAVLVAGFVVGALAQVLRLARRTPARPAGQLAHLAMLSLGGAVGLYLAGLLLFFAPPWAALLLESFTTTNLSRLFRQTIRHVRPIEMLGVLLGLWSAILVLGVPAGLVAAPALHARRALAVLRRAGAGAAAALTVLVNLSAGALTLALTLEQPQLVAFAATDAPPRSPESRRQWRDDAPAVRAGLVNAYLQRNRYFERDRDAHAVHYAYKEMGFAPETAERVQEAFNRYARVFIFDDSAREMSPADAEARFAAYLDADIDRAVASEVRAATRRRPWSTGPAAARQDIDARTVHLESQTIRIEPRDGYADVEVHDVYRSRSRDTCEVRLAFELPPHAALTGLYMGPTGVRGAAYPPILAPRGAARRVYEREVRRRIDPALLEQVGPRQFRLRVFPVPGRGAEDEAPQLHVWLTYQALPEEEGWPTPRLLEARNLYFDHETVRYLDDAPGLAHDGWLPARLPRGDEPLAPVRFDFTFGGSWLATPAGPTPAGPTGHTARRPRVAIVVDRSFSMAEARTELDRALHALQAGLRETHELSLVLTSAPTRGEPARLAPWSALDDLDLEPFGGQGLDDMLAQAGALAPRHDAWVLLTDGAPTPAGLEPVEFDPPRARVLILPVTGAPAPSRTDAVTRAVLASGGDTMPDVEAVVQDLRLQRRAAPYSGASRVLGRSGGWVFRYERVSSAPPNQGARGPRALATAWRIRAEMPASVGAPGDAVALDRLHFLAELTPVITPLSSMIVLITDAQRAALERGEAAADRFEVGQDDSALPLMAPAGIGGLSGAPEPGTWALLSLAAAGAAAARRRRREGAS